VISVTRLKLNKSVEQFHRGNKVQEKRLAVKPFNKLFLENFEGFQEHPQPFSQLIL
jgi:hypothetical protein